MSLPPDAPTPTDLFLLLTSGWIPAAICLVARLGIADELAEGPLTAAELAARAGLAGSPARLSRVLRALTTTDVLRIEDGGRFALGPLGRFLRSGVPGSMRAAAIAFHAPWRAAAWAKLDEAVRGEASGFEHAFGTDLFEYLGRDAEAGRAFYDGQSSVVVLTDEALLRSYDFSRFDRIVDVAGGQGQLLVRLLSAHPALRGVVFDLPYAIEAARARDLAGEAGVGDRISYVAGDVFRGFPEGADAYLIQRFIHGWEDEHAAAILANCRRAIRPGGHLLLVEAIVASGQPRSLGAFFDLEMMVVAGGKARTEEEHRALLRDAGFRFQRVVDTGTPFSMIEAVAAE